MRYPIRVRLAVAVGGCLLVAAAVSPVVAGPGPAGAAAPPAGTLHGEGGSFAEPIITTIEADTGLNTLPETTDFFNANVDNARDDFADGSADFAVSEFPLTSAQAATAAAAGRSFAYVPIAADAVALGAVVECSADVTLKSTTMCAHLQLDPADAADIFTQHVTQWSAIPTVQAGGPVAPTASSNTIVPLNLIDPSAGSYDLAAYLASTPAGKTTWDSFLTANKITDAAPSEVWPTDGGITGGDLNLANTLVPLDPSNNLPRVNPQGWGVGNVGPLAADWLTYEARDIPSIALENTAGSFVPPTVAATQAAEADATFDTSTNLVTFNASTTDKGAYPVVQMSYLIVHTTGLSPAKAVALASLIRFTLSAAGQKDIESLGAAPPTAAMIAAGENVADTVAAEGTTPTTTTTTTTTVPATTSTTAVTGAGGGSTDTGTGTDDSTGSDTVGSSSTGSGSSLAFTGADVWPLAGIGAMLVLVAALARRRLRRGVPG